ncbi:hypothetical protein [Herbaspirillum seropedicae]|uniref:hypothetical protein n=1 Tax=Herbaspirillum seropedicae TaxID=964 RepID=UPI000847FCFB|nr:hypothetical protein [Herbaspirillum seropedicae]AON56337.1 hypothetical protein Hsc_4078 [Herbaspirillum seropedicae]
MAGKRGRKLTPERVKEIVQIIESYGGEISWQKVVDSVERAMLTRYTRQALASHKVIQNAFSAAGLKVNTAHSKNPTDRRERGEARIARYKADNERLLRENDRLINLHVIWLYNANLCGLSEEQLNMPMPPVNRGQTKR